MLTVAAVGISGMSLGDIASPGNSSHASDSGGIEDTGRYNSAEPVTGFNIDSQDIGWVSLNSLHTRVDFTNAIGESYNVTLPDNTYYLLLHAEGSDPYNMGVYDEGESHDHYQLIELELEDGSSWDSGTTEILPTKYLTSPWGGAPYPVTPSPLGFDGTFLINSDPSTELTVEDAVARNGCNETGSIEGITLSGGDSINASSTGGWNNDTIRFDAKGGHEVDINVYDFDGTTLMPLDTESDDSYYALAYLVPKGSTAANNISGWAVQQFDPVNNSETKLCFWDFAARARLGVRIFLDRIPIRQETVEVCDLLGVNPYLLMSQGTLLMAADEEMRILEEFAAAAIPAAVIGYFTDGSDRVVINDGETRFLEPFRGDSFYKAFKKDEKQSLQENKKSGV